LHALVEAMDGLDRPWPFEVRARLGDGAVGLPKVVTTATSDLRTWKRRAKGQRQYQQSADNKSEWFAVH